MQLDERDICYKALYEFDYLQGDTLGTLMQALDTDTLVDCTLFLMRTAYDGIEALDNKEKSYLEEYAKAHDIRG